MAILPDYGRIIRGFGSNDNSLVVQPRPSYTFFATFHINPNVATGNLQSAGIATHKLFASLKSIGKPALEYDVEKLRAYNTPYLLKKKATYKDIPLVFYDDSTSFVQGMIKAYRAYHSYAGNKITDASEVTRATGFQTGAGSTNSGDNSFRVVDASDPNNVIYEANSDIVVTSSNGPTYGSRTGALQSLGMRPRAEKNFFEKIKIYDLGSEPNSINVYTIFNPMFTGVEQANMDYSTVSLQEVTCNLAYEDFTEEIGVDLNEALKSENFLAPALVTTIKEAYRERTGHFNGGSADTADVAVYDAGDALFIGQEQGAIVDAPTVFTNYATMLSEIEDDATITSWRSNLAIVPIDSSLTTAERGDKLLDLIDGNPNPTLDV